MYVLMSAQYDTSFIFAVIEHLLYSGLRLSGFLFFVVLSDNQMSFVLFCFVNYTETYIS